MADTTKVIASATGLLCSVCYGPMTAVYNVTSHAYDILACKTPSCANYDVNYNAPQVTVTKSDQQPS